MDREEMRRRARFIEHAFGRRDFAEVEDLRGSRGKKLWSVQQFSSASIAAHMSGQKTLDDAEHLTSELSGPIRKAVGVPKRLPDTTLRDYAVKADLDGHRNQLRKQAKSLHRSKAMRKAPGVTINMISVDGKYEFVKVRAVIAEKCPYFQQHGDQEGEYVRGEIRTISTTLVSSRATFYLDLVPVPGKTNEMGTFSDVFAAIVEDWGNTDLLELVATDSGSASLANATLVDDSGVGYLMVLDDFQPELMREAKRQLGPLSADQADGFHSERYQGKTVTHRIWRTTEMQGWNGWNHLRQVLRVERTVSSDDPNEPDKVGTRYFLTNLPVGRLSAEQWLTVVRLRWRVENGAHWTLDAILDEDNHPWTRNPHGLLFFQVLRRVALNILALYRGVHLRSHKNRARPWKRIVDGFLRALREADPQHLMDRRQLNRDRVAAMT